MVASVDLPHMVLRDIEIPPIPKETPAIVGVQTGSSLLAA